MNHPNRIGEYVKSSVVGGEYYSAYVPRPLPPSPPLVMEDFYPLLDQALVSLGQLSGMSSVLPDPSLFIYMYVRKEAVLSSQIEGTQSTLSDLLLFENKETPGVPMDDVQEVSSYVAALNFGLQRLEALPLSLRLMREIHAKLMENSRGGNKTPGEFRTSQNWLGGTRPGNAQFVPPPPDRLMEVLGQFETFLHNETLKMPSLIKAAMAHVQFETIHPFLDGNGRLGRLLITLMLCHEGILKEPLLYLSLYFKTHKQEYYDHLQSVRETGSWESWIQFFLKGVRETSVQATQTAKAIQALFETDRKTIESSDLNGKAALSVYSILQKKPIVNTTFLKKESGKTLPTVLRSLSGLEKLGIVKEISGKERHKLFAYSKYIEILNEGL